MPPFPPPRLSCDRSTWIGYDYEKRKLRLHFDAEKVVPKRKRSAIAKRGRT